MFDYNNIIKDENPDLRKICKDVKIPLEKEDIETLKQMSDYLKLGYEEDAREKYNIRPGVGIAAPQIDVLKRMFVLMAFDEKDVLYHFGVINPKIISESVEMCYLENGEGCLSVTDEHKGYIHRPKRIKAKFYCYDFEKDECFLVTEKFKGYISIVFQHEYDHLDGKLFFDHINKDNPFYVPENSGPIVFK